MHSPSTAKIFNVQKYSIYDGPGIRTIVFFSGCPLSCLWCSNPEGQRLEPAVRLFQNLCVKCGACVPACPEGLHTIAGEPPLHTVRGAGCTGCGACVQARRPLAEAPVSMPKGVLLEMESVPWLKVE